MRVSVEIKEGSKREMTVVVPPERVEKEVDQRLRSMAPKVKLSGFRAGKVPKAEINRRYGASVRQEVIGKVVQDTFHAAIVEKALQLTGEPPKIDIKTATAGQPLEYTAEFEVLPEFSVVTLEGVSIDKPNTTLQDNDIDDAVENLRKQHAVWKDVDRAAKEGDQVIMNYKGMIDGVAFDGGSADDVPLTIGSRTMIPGFEEGLVDLKAGDEKTLNLIFPENYQNDLAGKAADFEIKVIKVQESDLPPLDDSLAEKFKLKTSTLEALREEVRKNLQRSLTQVVTGHLKKQVIENLVKLNDIDTPDVLVNNEIKRLQEDLANRYANGSKDMAKQILKTLKPEDFSEQAKNNVKISLIYNQIMKVKKFKPDEEKVKEHIETLSTAYQDPEKIVSWYYNNPEQLSQVKQAVVEEQLIDDVLKTANVTEKTLTYAELLELK